MRNFYRALIPAFVVIGYDPVSFLRKEGVIWSMHVLYASMIPYMYIHEVTCGCARVILLEYYTCKNVLEHCWLNPCHTTAGLLLEPSILLW